MIARLKGLLDSLGPQGAVIDVGGVGYLVACSGRTLAALPAVGKPVSLHVETLVRDEQIHLYGFRDMAEKEWFRLLMTVQGVGPRVALAILTVLSPDEVARAIAAEDRAMLTRAEGVGPRLAARIFTELKDKIGIVPFAAAKAEAPVPEGAERDAVSALVNLGYGRAEAFGAVARASQKLGPGAAVEALVRGGLKELSA